MHFSLVFCRDLKPENILLDYQVVYVCVCVHSYTCVLCTHKCVCTGVHALCMHTYE